MPVPYAGNPANYPEDVEILSGSDAPSTTSINTPFENLADRTAYLYAQLGHQNAQNWSPEFQFDSAGGFNWVGMGWSPIVSQWLLFGGHVANGMLATTYGLDEGTAAAWTEVGGATFANVGTIGYGACSADPSTGSNFWCATTDPVNAPNNHQKLWLYNGSSWSNAPGGWSSYTAAGTVYGVELCTFGSYLILARSGTGTGDSELLSSNNGFSTWTTFSSPPAAGANGTWYLKSNAGMPGVVTPTVVAVQGWTGAGLTGGGTGGQGLGDVYYSTDGHTWNTSTSLAGIMAATDAVVGLAWTQDANGPCWLAAVQPASGVTYFCRSPDGDSWTLQSGGVSTKFTISDMAAYGGVLVAVVLEPSIAAFSGPHIFSTNGGVTWYPTQATFTSNISAVGLNRPRVIASPTGFMMSNGVWTRFSSLSGLPAEAI